MEIMRPCLGKIFPWMHARVAADKAFLPIGRRSVGIVAGPCLLVVAAFIANLGSESILPIGVLDQSIPTSSLLKNFIAGETNDGKESE
jgi:hypothetical protein